MWTERAKIPTSYIDYLNLTYSLNIRDGCSRCRSVENKHTHTLTVNRFKATSKHNSISVYYTYLEEYSAHLYVLS